MDHESADETSPVSQVLDKIREEVAGLTGGRLADYIPELAGVDPGLFGIAAVSAHGRSYCVGESELPFTIQSISKPFVYAIAVEQLGLDTVHEHVGAEPSGEPFNAISLDEHGRPENPMINAGAIVTTSLVESAEPDRRFDRIRSVLSSFAGRELEVDEDVFRSEAETGHRNRALGYLSLAGGVLVGQVEDAVQDYFRQCSLSVTVRDLAVMAATLAVGGVNPVTEERVVSQRTARHTLSIMSSCGMYDHAGEWGLRVGIPAKSGVSGGILAAAPGAFGVGVFSPPLDDAGNSVRGVAALERLSDDYDLHMLQTPSEPPSPMHSVTRDGSRLDVRLRGEIDFLAAEQVVSRLEEAIDDARVTSVSVALERVSGLSDAARSLLAAELSELADAGVEATVSDPRGVRHA
ncbi:MULTISPECIES: glutaminase A [unclassified Nocardiopsis]|uniref:glutaminase A n=1 Tax=unclassified Nocardiopsis TaxID=2649073 RepID=UPI00066E15A6|nr:MULTISPECIES: glutaminase A [unclassified Nocardiopsis]MBQ1080455.1 glutaminase A [Nocardiopsis sp. B62]